MTYVMGIDPGARFVAVTVLDLNEATQDETIIYSGTFKRPDDMLPVMWATVVTKYVLEVKERFPNIQVGIENVAPPQSHFQGKKNLMNPKYLIHLAIVVGALANAMPDAVMVRPGKNGSKDNDSYPPEIVGRRPKTLDGPTGKAAGTRNHERSSYDVAKQTPRLHRENYLLDTQKGVFDE